MAGYFREISVRMFAKELKDSDLIYREEEEQYAPQYILTPTGAKANRVLISGTLTEVENIGNGSEYYRARIADPTGIFTIYAGQYQAEATRFLAEAETPSFVTVVGKVAAFKADDGNNILSIRPEYIQKTNEKDRNIWVAETAKKTYERIAAAEEQLQDSEQNPQTDLSSKISNSKSENIRNALKHYTPEFSKYREMTLNALETIEV